MYLNLVEVLASNKFPVTEIVLSGKTIRAKVDTVDIPKVLSVSTRWRATWDIESATFYVKSSFDHLLHRVVTDAPPQLTVDHFDHDGLNNRRINLRVVPQHINSANRRMKLGVSGFRNVVPRPNGKFRASFVFKRRRIILGDFLSPETAFEAVREARKDFDLPVSAVAKGEIQ